MLPNPKLPVPVLPNTSVTAAVAAAGPTANRPFSRADKLVPLSTLLIAGLLNRLLTAELRNKLLTVGLLSRLLILGLFNRLLTVGLLSRVVTVGLLSAPVNAVVTVALLSRLFSPPEPDRPATSACRLAPEPPKRPHKPGPKPLRPNDPQPLAAAA
ncbi:hypothetical protein BST16_27925, partial [Mycobacterium asiaticum DSM 44297]